MSEEFHLKIKVFIKKKLLLSATFLFVGTLYAAGKPKLDQSIFTGLKKNVDLQAIYNDMTDLTPAVACLAPESTSSMPKELINMLSEELKNQMILTGYFKPVSLNKWLGTKYVQKKASNIYNLISDLKSERFPINLVGVCKPFIFKVGNQYVLYIALYPFSEDGYPLTSIKFFSCNNDIKDAIKYSLQELNILFKQSKESKIRLAIAPFTIECKTLLEQKSREFDFISTSFSEQEGVEVKTSDDYFSNLFTHQANATGLFKASLIGDIPEYIEQNSITAESLQGFADYLITSRIILSDKVNLIKLSIYSVKTGRIIDTIEYFTKKLSLKEIWNFNFYFLQKICQLTCKQNSYTVIQKIEADKRGFYLNNMFLGWNSLDGVPVKTGKIIINTGSYFSSDSIQNSIMDSALYKNNDFYIYTTNSETQIFTGREGEYVWNLLEK